MIQFWSGHRFKMCRFWRANWDCLARTYLCVYCFCFVVKTNSVLLRTVLCATKGAAVLKEVPLPSAPYLESTTGKYNWKVQLKSTPFGPNRLVSYVTMRDFVFVESRPLPCVTMCVCRARVSLFAFWQSQRSTRPSFSIRNNCHATTRTTPIPQRPSMCMNLCSGAPLPLLTTRNTGNVL